MSKEPVKILLLEDKPVHEGLLGDELEDSGFRVKRARNISDAREILESFRPDLFLFDLVMQNDHVSVLEWVGELRKTSVFQDVPILFVTAFYGEYKEKIKDLPATMILNKPFAFGDVHKCIKEILSS